MKKNMHLLESIIFLYMAFSILSPKILSGQEIQPYQPMALEGAHWTIALWDNNNPPWAQYDLYQYVIRGDSLYNEILYKKVYYREMNDSSGIIISENLGGLMRDDTINRKVYTINFGPLKSYDCPTNEEFLLYDFSLEEGDTANFCTIVYPDWYVIYINYYNEYGKVRKHIKGSYFDDFLIEGIGSNYGVFEWGMGSKNSIQNSRGWEYFLSDYCLGTDQDCDCKFVGINDEQKNPSFSIYPNPLYRNILYLKSSFPINEEIEVHFYDLVGKEIFRTNYRNFGTSQSIELPSSVLNNTSVIFLIIRSLDMSISKKIIIN